MSGAIEKTRGESRGVLGRAGGGYSPSTISPSLGAKRLTRNKFGAVKVTIDNIVFDSKREAKFYGDLKLRERAGEIDRLECHPQFTLAIDGALICKYKPDFKFFDKAQYRFRIVDVKSEPTAKKRDFVLVRKLFEAIFKTELEVWF